MNNHFNKTKWQTMTIFEQMGNIGSEVGRALSAKKRGDKIAMEGALYRGVDLLDATAEAWVGSPNRVREILRSREQFTKSVTTKTEDQSLEEYFMQFAIAARTRQLK